MIIRPENQRDRDAIHQLTDTAFAPMPFADGNEGQAIRDLRNDGDLTLSLVAEEGGKIIGHVAFSPMTIEGQQNGWFSLGPISVAIDRQRQGIGSALMRKGFEMMQAKGARGIALIGNPKVYGAVGFESDGKLTYRDLPVEIVQRIVFSGGAPSGEVRFADALEAAY